MLNNKLYKSYMVIAKDYRGRETVTEVKALSYRLALVACNRLFKSFLVI